MLKLLNGQIGTHAMLVSTDGSLHPISKVYPFQKALCKNDEYYTTTLHSNPCSLLNVWQVPSLQRVLSVAGQ